MKKKKEEFQKASKLSGDKGNQGVCWGEYINVSLLTDYWCTLSALNMARAGEMSYIVRAYFARRQFGVNLTHLHERWRHSLVYYCPNSRTWKLLLPYNTIYCDILWKNRKNVRPLPDGKVFTCRTPYGNTVRYYWRSVSQWHIFYTVCHFSCSYSSKRLLRR